MGPSEEGWSDLGPLSRGGGAGPDTHPRPWSGGGRAPRTGGRTLQVQTTGGWQCRGQERGELIARLGAGQGRGRAGRRDLGRRRGPGWAPADSPPAGGGALGAGAQGFREGWARAPPAEAGRARSGMAATGTQRPEHRTHLDTQTQTLGNRDTWTQKHMSRKRLAIVPGGTDILGYKDIDP